MKNPGDVLMEEGTDVKKLYLLYMGEADIIVDGVLVATVGSGQFLGELAYFTKDPATATVRTKTVCHLIEWDIESCRHIAHHHDHSMKSEAFAMLPSLFCRDLAKKMAKDNSECKQ